MAFPSAQVTVSGLQVESEVAPVGVDVNPRFSWIVGASQRDVMQTSYQILVSKNQAGANDVWDSGIVSSKKPYLIDYAGPSLASDTRYFWTVNIVTTAGAGTASSEFTTGFLSSLDWGSSSWIGKPTAGQSIPDALISSFRSSSWIWTSETGAPNAPPGDRAFRRMYPTPTGKTAVSALVLITVDDQFTLYLNGNPLGSSPTTQDIWKTSQKFSTSLNPTSNVFAVRATNIGDVSTGGDGPAGLLTAIQITFSDGTTSIITSDSSWRSIKAIPSNFQSPSFDDSSWAAATIISPYGSGPWASNVALPSSDTTPAISLADSTWIWSSLGAASSAPAQQIAFRRTVSTPAGKTLKSAVILLTVDNGFTLHVNGVLVGSSPNETDIWKSAQRFTVPLSGTSSTLFAIKATNLPDVNSGGESPAGLLAAIQIVFTDGSTTVFLSDGTWKITSSIPTGYELPSTNDSSWTTASALGKYGVSPWNNQVTLSDSLGEHPAPLLRKEFSVTKSISFARLYYTAGGYASITINGVPASDHVLTPGFTKYDVQVQYVVLDVVSKLTTGSNAIGVELGRSHYGVTQGSVWNWNTAPWHGEPSFRAILSIGYSDGTTARIITDASWMVIDGPTRLDDVFGGENYDARYLQAGFDKPGFIATGWTTAQVVAGPKGALVRQHQPPTKVVQSLTPISIKLVNGVYVVAFERVVSGWAKIRVTGPARTLITIHFGEKLKSDGTVIFEDSAHYYANNFQTDRFWLAGSGQPETFEPKFSYKGFQYVQVEGWPSGSAPSTGDIVGQVVHDDLPVRGGFSSSSDLLNKMHTASVYTMLNNVHSIPEDCPTFEKNGWSGDAMLGTEMFLTNLGAEGLLAKYVRDLAESRPNGSGPPGVIAPDSGWGANNQAPTWHSAFIFIPWWLYQYRGDRRVLEDHYDSMKSYVSFELGRSPNNIANTGLGDWVSPETSPLGGNAPEDTRISATAYLYKMLVTMGQIANVLGKSSDVTTFNSQAANVKLAFNNAFLSPSTGYYVGVGDSGYRQTHNLLAIAFGLTPNSTTTQNAADSISRDVVSRGNHLNTGALGTKYILPVLTDYQHGDVAFAVAQQTTFPSWGFWISNGANTMWEHWALEARSRDHLFLGTFEDWLYKYLVGIQLSSPAFESVNIAPTLTSQLASAQGWTITPFGNLSVSWANSPSQFKLDVKVPVSVNATITIPATTSQQILEGGEQLDAQGMQVLGAENNKVRVSVGSGQYSFTVAK